MNHAQNHVFGTAMRVDFVWGSLDLHNTLQIIVSVRGLLRDPVFRSLTQSTAFLK